MILLKYEIYMATDFKSQSKRLQIGGGPKGCVRDFWSKFWGVPQGLRQR